MLNNLNNRFHFFYFGATRFIC